MEINANESSAVGAVEKIMSGPSAKIFTSSSEKREVPVCDLLTWTFGNSNYDLDKPLFVDAQCPERTISYNVAKTIGRRLIAGLKYAGLQPGETVCFHSSNDIYYALIYLAVIGAGGRFLGTNPNYTSAELEHLFTTAEVKFVIAEKGHVVSVKNALDKLGLDMDNLYVFDGVTTSTGGDLKRWETLLDHGEEDWHIFEDEHTCKNRVACLMTTSGTTGLPKAAKFSHYSQIANCVAIQEMGKPYEVSRLLCLPQFHAFNAPISLLLPIREGVTVYVMKKYEPNAYLNALRTFRPTETTMVNPIVFKLLELCAGDLDALSSLRQISTGGVRLPPAPQARLQELLHPSAVVRQVYGMTEVGWAISLLRPEEDSTGAAGKLLPGVEARLVNEDGEDVFADRIEGEILLRTPSVMNGYLNNPLATNQTIVDGWVYTGDVAYQENGKWYIVDRKKEIIKVRGWQVSPTEIEQCLMTHPAIMDVAVIGVDFEDDRGELPRAYIVFDPKHKTTDQDVKDFLRDKLIHYKRLSGGIRRKETLPRNSLGKVLKNLLRAEVKEELLQHQMSLLRTKSPTSEDKENLIDHKIEDRKPSTKRVFSGTLTETVAQL